MKKFLKLVEEFLEGMLGGLLLFTLGFILIVI
jgi:hypothetical protein